MSIRITVFLVIVVGQVLLNCTIDATKKKGSQNKSGEKSRVLLISLDGFGWDYMKKTSSVNLDAIARKGVKAKYIRSCFPTTTYPNHFTMVTGLYPESHGIIANYMWDPKFKSEFDVSNIDPKWWNAFGAVPLWITNQQQGGRSALIHWPGYNVSFQGKKPDFNLMSPSFDLDLGNQTGNVTSFEERINVLMKWLANENPPNFIAMYFEEPDGVGHKYGPNSEEVKRMIRKMDAVVGKVVERLRAKGMLDSTNIIVTSDHGMAEISSSKQIFVDNYVDPKTYDVWDASTNLMISPHKGQEDDIYNKFKRVPHVKVYRKKDIPKRLHFSKNRRVPELFVMAEDGWTITRWKKHDDPNTHWIRGNHGFSNDYKSQAGFLVGRGPAFRAGYEAEGFDNVHLYPLLCRLLGVKPRPNNGTIAVTNGMLTPIFDARMNRL